MHVIIIQRLATVGHQFQSFVDTHGRDDGIRRCCVKLNSVLSDMDSAVNGSVCTYELTHGWNDVFDDSQGLFIRHAFDSKFFSTL